MTLFSSTTLRPVAHAGLCLTLLLSCLPPAAQAQSSKASQRKAAASAPTPTAPATSSASSSPVAAPVPGMPLFYRSLVAFDSVKHRDLGLPKEWHDYSYARQANVIPLVVNEAVQALRHYPLVFIKDATSGAINLVALVSNGNGVNQFVDAKGQWQANTYIPAWVRRYPFLMATDDQQRTFLAFDAQAPQFAAKSPREALLDADGKPTPRLQQVITFQTDYANAAKLTEQMAQKLFDAGVLEEARLSLQSSEGAAPTNLVGFLLINQKKLRELPSAELEKLHAADALGLAYAQIFSMGNLRQLRLPVSATGKP